MTNEEYLKKYTGKDFLNCIYRYFINNELCPYIDWERWLSNERSAFFFKGIPGKYTQPDDSTINCIIVDSFNIMGENVCKIIVFSNGKYNLITVLKENVTQTNE